MFCNKTQKYPTKKLTNLFKDNKNNQLDKNIPPKKC